MKQIRATMQFLKTRSFRREANVSKKRVDNLKKLKVEKKEKINDLLVFKEDGRENQITEGRHASGEKIRRGSEDARSSSDESESIDVSWQVVRKRKRKGKQGGKAMKKTDGREVEEQKKARR